MGTLTQVEDYLRRKPLELTQEFIKENYSHITISPELKKLRRELKLYREVEK